MLGDFNSKVVCIPEAGVNGEFSVEGVNDKMREGC